MSDMVGEYDVPKDVPEWEWVEQNASLSHRDNGTDGIWDFMLNLAVEFEDIPEKLEPLIAKAIEFEYRYILFHQGT